jgi:hypothetical protein
MDQQTMFDMPGTGPAAEEDSQFDPVTGKQDEFVKDDNFSYSGYQITREEFFAHAREPSLRQQGLSA